MKVGCIRASTVNGLNTELLHTEFCAKLHAMFIDRMIIKSLGGPAVVARNFGYSVQQVSNWGRRGIPAKEIVENQPFATALKRAGYKRVCNSRKKKAA